MSTIYIGYLTYALRVYSEIFRMDCYVFTHTIVE